MIKIFALLVAMALALPVNLYAGWNPFKKADKCDFLPKKPAPAWVGAGYERHGYYIGIGTSGKRESVDEQIEASKQSALAEISSSISVSIKSSLKDTLMESGRNGRSEMEQSIEMETESSVEQTLRDIKYEEMWLDRKNCQLWTLAVVSRASVLAVQKEIEEKLRRKFTSKKLMLFAFDKSGPAGISERVYGNLEKVFRDMDVKVIAKNLSLLECAKGVFSGLCAENPETIFGGFKMKYEREKLSDDGRHRARFYRFEGALYFRERRISSFNVSCRGTGRTGQEDSALDDNAADACVKKVQKKLKEDMRKSE